MSKPSMGVGLTVAMIALLFAVAAFQTRPSHGSEPSGPTNTLITEYNGNRVIEVDSSGNIVWQMTGLNMPVHAERLDNGNTLIADTWNQRVIEVDRQGNVTVIWEKAGLPCPTDAERLDNGNTLICCPFWDNVVLEVDASGNTVWQMSGLRWPFAAERLDNGNTLIAECGGGRVIEVDNCCNIVWEVTGLYEPMSAERLDNGNTLIADGRADRVIEVAPSGEIVWSYSEGLDFAYDAERLDSGNTLITDRVNKRVIEVNRLGNIVWQWTCEYEPYSAERVAPTNRPPVANAGPDRTVESTGQLTEVSLDGTASSDPDGNPLTYQWSVPDGSGILLDDPTGPTPIGSFPVGSWLLTLTVFDDQGAFDADDVYIVVDDTTAPTIADCTTDVGLLWPPDHRMQEVTLLVQAYDLCTPTENLQLTCDISSNEPDDGTGDGAFIFDVDGEDGFTCPVVRTLQYNPVSGLFETTVFLRAERDGAQNGRQYSFIVYVSDCFGNTSSCAGCCVVVPHDQRTHK